MAQWGRAASAATEQRSASADHAEGENGARPFGEAPRLSEAERHRLLVEWNDTDQAFSAHACIHQLFEAQAAHTPDTVALSFGDEHLTYRELNARADRLAHRLRGLGVGPEVVVGIHARRSPAMVAGLLGILKAGGAYLPLDPGYPTDRLAFMLEDARVSVLVTEKASAERLPRHSATPVYLDDEQDASTDVPSDKPPDAGCTAESAAYVIYTSGSTGRPKGVIGLHRGAVNRFHWMWQAYPFEPGEICCQKTTLSFVDSIWEIFGPLLRGVRTVLVPDEAVKDPARLVQTLAEQRVTRIVLVPSLLRAILDLSDELQRLLPDLRFWVSSGEALSPELARRFRAAMPHARLINLYGQSEASADATYFDTGDGGWDERVPIGRPIANMQLYILDERREPVPIGQPGELYVSGAGLARGYLHRPELTDEKFIPHPFSDAPGARLYRTGDVARYRPDGNVEYIGRVDHQVKIRGQRIELGEIEAVLAQHAAVDRALVVAREDTPGEPRLVAYLVAAGESSPTAGELREFLLAKLPEAWVPAAFVVLERFPLTPSGKVDRNALPPPDRERLALGSAFVAPHDGLERELAGLWERLLDVRPVGATDSFFDLGGHSLLAASLFDALEERYGRRLPLATLLRAATVRDLAQILSREERSDGWSPLVAIQPNGSRPPLFFMHAEGGNVVGYQPLALRLGPDQPFYGLQSRGLDGTEVGALTIEEMAADYVAAIRSVQPHGPYYLGGYCLGGMLAIEMAQQLRAEHEEVALVAMVQAETADYPRPAPNSTRLHRIADRVWRRLGEELATLGPVDGRARVDHIYQSAGRLLARAAVVLERRAEPLLRRGPRSLPSRAYLLRSLIDAQEHAFNTYRPASYRGRVAIFRAGVQPRWIMQDPTLGWGRHLDGELELHVVPGYHHNVLKEPRVQQLAQTLRASLDRARVAAEAAR